MKTTTIQLIKADLLSTDSNFPLLAVYKISRLFVNKDLINFFERLLNESKEQKEKLIILLKLKKLVIQVVREPDPTQLKAESDEFRDYFKSIKKGQKFYDPIKWLDAEIDYLTSIKNLTDQANRSDNVDIEKKEWLNRKEVLQLFDISKSTLNRRISEGMPVNGVGVRQMFNRQELNVWLHSLKLEVKL